MPNTFKDADYLLGKRFVTDFQVVAVSGQADPEQTATLNMYGERYVISLDELATIIERGFVVEAGARES